MDITFLNGLFYLAGLIGLFERTIIKKAGSVGTSRLAADFYGGSAPPSRGLASAYRPAMLATSQRSPLTFAQTPIYPQQRG